MRKTYIFDLDGTVIDSSHRHLSKPDGSLDLENWLANCTFEKIFADSLMPLAAFWRNAYAHHSIVICTARTMGAYDWMFLRHHGLHFDHALYRHKGDNRPDGEMKKDKLLGFFQEMSVSPLSCEMFEDNLSVHKALLPVALKVTHPNHWIG